MTDIYSPSKSLHFILQQSPELPFAPVSDTAPLVDLLTPQNSAPFSNSIDVLGAAPMQPGQTDFTEPAPNPALAGAMPARRAAQLGRMATNPTEPLQVDQTETIAPALAGAMSGRRAAQLGRMVQSGEVDPFAGESLSSLTERRGQQVPLRQTTGFVESLLALTGLEWPVPDFSTLCRRQRTLPVSIPYRGSSGPLHLLIDSTEIKAEGEGEWNARKHGGPKRRLWRKIYIGIDEETLEIRAVEVTSSSIGDAPMLPDLLNQIPADEDLGSVTADGAFDTRKCHDAIAARNSHAVIPPRKNAKFWKADTPGAIARNEAVRSSKYLGRALWRHLTGYHRRSRVETKMHCLKLLGQRLSARDFDRQVAEIQIRAAILNGFTALGIPKTVAAA